MRTAQRLPLQLKDIVKVHQITTVWIVHKRGALLKDIVKVHQITTSRQHFRTAHGLKDIVKVHQITTPSLGGVEQLN